MTTSLAKQKDALQAEGRGIDRLTAQQEQALRRSEMLLNRELGQFTRQLALTRQLSAGYAALLQRIRPLVAKGYVSLMQVQQQEAQALESQAQTEALMRQEADTERQLSEVRSELAQLPTSSENKQSELQRQHAQLQQAIAENEAARLSTVVATSAGTVSSLLAVAGVDLRHLGKSTYREMVGSVMQDDRLFAGTIEDNISFFDHSASMSDVVRAATRAQLHSDISTMPMGYRSLVGDMGAALSGGQQQRLWLARLFYRNPAIAVLDEATSHLDAAAEKIISDEFSKANMTRVMVAHRAETIRSADRVMLVEKGRVKELVPHL